MPCDTLQTNTVKLADNVSPDLLGRAMLALGIRSGQYTHDAAAGQVVIRGYTGQNVTQAEIAQAYSAEVVKATASKRGWKLKEVSKFKYVVTKGGI